MILFTDFKDLIFFNEKLSIKVLVYSRTVVIPVFDYQLCVAMVTHLQAES